MIKEKIKKTLHILTGAALLFCMRHEKEPRLNDIARRLTGVQFENFEQTCAEYRHLIGEGAKIHYSTLLGSAWLTKISIANQQRVVGICYNSAKSARFADAAVVFFWPYRSQMGRQLAKKEFNFSQEQAERDLDTNAPLRQLLEDFRDELISRGELCPRAAGEAESEVFKLDQIRGKAKKWLADTRELRRLVARAEYPGILALKAHFEEHIDEAYKAAEAFLKMVPNPKMPTEEESRQRLEEHERRCAAAELREAEELRTAQQLAEFERAKVRTVLAAETTANNPDELKFSPEDVDAMFKQAQQQQQ